MLAGYSSSDEFVAVHGRSGALADDHVRSERRGYPELVGDHSVLYEDLPHQLGYPELVGDHSNLYEDLSPQRLNPRQHQHQHQHRE